MAAAVGPTRQRSVSSRSKGALVPPAGVVAGDGPWEPCASTDAFLLFAQGSTIVCLRRDTLALERRFEKHSKDIQFISADNVSETGAGRLVVTYDVGKTAIVWDLVSGEQLSRFVSYESLKVAHWMRNGNIAFGNAKGEVILFEPATSDHISARTIFDPITAIAPSSDCKTYAIGYNNGSILLAALQPSFTILHTLTTNRAPSPIAALTWHASSSKQKSDMLATQTADGDLRVWSVSKPSTAEAPRVIRALKRSESFVTGRNWISWSKNGRIVQWSEGKTWAWDVRTKHVTYEPIPTVDGVRGVTAHGPTGTLYTLGPDYTVQQYDVERAQLVANVRVMPITIPPTPPEDTRGPMWTTSESEEEVASPLARARRELRAAEAARPDRNNVSSPQSGASSQKMGSKHAVSDMISPAGRTDYTTTSFDTGIQSQWAPNAPIQLLSQQGQTQSPLTARSARKGSRLKQEVIMSPEERPVLDLFPFTRARLHDVPYRQSRPLDESHMTPQDLRRQMLSVVFGWEEDVQDLVRDELSRHPDDSQNAMLLARWLDEDPDYLAEILGSTSWASNLDWMLLALGTISNQHGAQKITQVFIEKLLSKGDIHAAATLMLALGDKTDAIEVYVSRHQYMEAVLLTCLVSPDDWQRQSYLVRRWGEHVVENSQQSLAIRCFSCTGVEPSEPWTSPGAQLATNSALEVTSSPQVARLNVMDSVQYPPIFHKTLDRRRTLDAPTPVAMPPPHAMAALPAPPTPFRTAAAQGTRITPQTSALKLITSFGPQSSNTFKFPGLKPEDRTPTVAAAVTPIAESAIDRSALSPGGLGSYRLNNIRSINSALSTKTATPGDFRPNRLSAIGETPVEGDAPQFPASPHPRSMSLPTDSSSTKHRGTDGATPSHRDPKGGELASLTVLTSARYDPLKSPIKATPQTAVGPPASVQFPASNTHSPFSTNNDAADLSRLTNGSRSRKPDRLSIHTLSVEPPQANSDRLPSISLSDIPTRPNTTGPDLTTSRETSGPDVAGPTTAGQNYRGTKSPAVGGRSIDQYISSLEQAQYYEKHPRARGYSSASRQSKDDRLEGKKLRETLVDDGQENAGRRGIPPAKRSPSSPVPMSPDDVRMYSTSAESFDSLYGLNLTGFDRSDTPMGVSKLSRRGSQSTTKGTGHRHTSRSRQGEPRSKTGSRAPSRQGTPDHAVFSPRGRSSSRKENLGHRSPSSPRPMIPSEEDRRPGHDDPSALRLVSRDRHRLHRSSSRQPLPGTGRDPSPERPRRKGRSSSRPDDGTTLSRKGSRAERHRRHRRPSDPEGGAPPDDVEDANAGPAMESRDHHPSDLRAHTPDRGKKSSAAEALEARRQSLTRRPSVPNVPLPSQLSRHVKSASTSNVVAPSRMYGEDEGVNNQSPDKQEIPQMNSVAPGVERLGTPKATLTGTAAAEGDVQSPAGGVELLSSDVYRPTTHDDLSKPGSSRPPPSFEFLSQMPKHPAYDHRIANSRSSSKGPDTRASSQTRGTSRDRTRVSPPEVSIESFIYNGSPPSQQPPLLPELQHLAAPPPPPPPPPPPKLQLSLDIPNLSHARSAEAADPTNIPLPMSAIPSLVTDGSGNANPLSAPLQGHRRGRSGHENNGSGSGSSQLLGKIRHFAGRVRSPSRGRRGGDDNMAMSPRMNGERISPYESIPSAMMGSVGL